jgi:hypothetical protein
MDSQGNTADAARDPPNVTAEQALSWYTDMLTGMAWISACDLEHTLMVRSEHTRRHHVRCSEARTHQLLHGTFQKLMLVAYDT